MDGRTDGRKDGRNGRTDGRMHGRRQNYIPPTSSGDNNKTRTIHSKSTNNRSNNKQRINNKRTAVLERTADSVSVWAGMRRVKCILLVPNGPRREKTCLRGFTNNKGADQPAHPRSLISAFVIRFLESIISKLATSETLIV